jgi:hypothetical protein
MRNHRSILALICFLLAGAGTAAAQSAITFQNIANAGGAGLAYGRVPSARNAIQEAFQADGILNVVTEYRIAPLRPRGNPGVALLDYDGDGDLDIYVTNGPGAANSLFASQLRQTGQLQFVDVATAAGVDATGQDSQGVCFGDTDNDGDPDLLVLGSSQSNRFFENQGDGTFDDITAVSGAGGLTTNSMSCSMGDIDGDGRLDILISNTFDFTAQRIYTTPPTSAFAQPNQLLHNDGGNTFSDVSATSGIRSLVGPPGLAVPTWAASLVDYDLDGDLDVVAGAEQRAFPQNQQRGFIRVFRNDGTGHFTDVSAAAGMSRTGNWHGFSFGDLNCDGRLDFFAANVGDYVFFPGIFPVGTWSSRWYLGQAGGTFADPGPGALATVPNAWGNTILDYDNDGDLDIALHGGQDSPLFWDASNPGIVLRNEGCSAQFTWDSAALAATDHTRRIVDGVAAGDLNGDGFVDLVSVAEFVIPPAMSLLPIFSAPLGSPFDPTALYGPSFLPTANPQQFAWLGISPENGTLAVEINSGGNGNGWVAVDVLGTVGLLNDGRVNRDGIGATVSVTSGSPARTVVKPVVAGSSYSSQDSLTSHFGLGTAGSGTVEVRWPGGTRNRLYDMQAGERVVFPEIPCSLDGDWRNQGEFVTCNRRAIKLLEDAGVLDHAAGQRFFLSAIQAYHEENP